MLKTKIYKKFNKVDRKKERRLIKIISDSVALSLIFVCLVPIFDKIIKITNKMLSLLFFNVMIT